LHCAWHAAEVGVWPSGNGDGHNNKDFTLSMINIKMGDCLQVYHLGM